jgi:DNA polymerase-3 subunit delta'
VLASEAAHQLLPTIRSRCITYTMAWPAEADALAWLKEQGVAPADAPVLLRAAGDRPADALRYWQAGRHAKSWQLLPKAVARGDVSALADLSPPQAINALHKLCHDLLAVHAGAAPRFYAAQDLPPPGSPHALSAWAKALAQAARTAEHPFNAGLMLESLVSEARTALNSKPRP